MKVRYLITAFTAVGLATVTACGQHTSPSTAVPIMSHVATQAPETTTTAAPTTTVAPTTTAAKIAPTTKIAPKPVITQPARQTVQLGGGEYMVICNPGAAHPTICYRSPGNQAAHDSWVGGQVQQACQTGSCWNAQHGLSDSDVKRQTDQWLRAHPGYCRAGQSGAVAPC